MRLAHATVACLAGAGLALFGATRVWSVQVTARPGLPELRTAATGAQTQPWLLALAVIALAGAGAMLATRGPVRRGLGVVLMVVGAGMSITAIAGRAGTDAGAAGPGATVWPIACVLGGALVVLAGLGAARHGHRWPVMGARYERRPVPWPADRPGDPSRPSPAAGPDAEIRNAGGAVGTGAAGAGAADGGTVRAGADSGGATGAAAGDGNDGAVRRPTAGDAQDAPVDNRALWDALDRGDDPTAR